MDQEVRWEGQGAPEQTPKGEVAKVFLPPVLAEDDTEFMNAVWPHVKLDLIDDNIKLINSVTDSRLEPQDREAFSLYRDVVNERYRQYRSKLRKIAGAPHIIDALSAIDPTVVVMSDERVAISKVTATAHEQLTNAKGDVLLLSRSHVSAVSELRALKKVAGDRKIGLVIFDRHADIYDTERHRQWRIDNNVKVTENKGNFVAFLLDEGTIDSVSFIGVPRDRAREIVDGYPRGDEFAPTHEIFQAFEDQIGFANEERYINRQERIDRDQFNAEINRQINFLKFRNVDIIIFSLDADVLQFSYSAVEYNNLSMLLHLGVQDFSQAREIALNEYKSLTPEMQNSYDLLVRRDRLIADAVLRNSSLTAAHVGDLQLGAPKSIGGHGLKLGDVGIAMDLIGHEFPVGVELPNGGICPGGITELSAFDIDSQTAKAVKAVSDRMLRVAHKSAEEQKGSTYTSG